MAIKKSLTNTKAEEKVTIDTKTKSSKAKKSKPVSLIAEEKLEATKETKPAKIKSKKKDAEKEVVTEKPKTSTKIKSQTKETAKKTEKAEKQSGKVSKKSSTTSPEDKATKADKKPSKVKSKSSKKVTNEIEVPEGMIVNPLLGKYTDAEIETAKGTFLSCLLPLAPDVEGKQYSLKEVLPMFVTPDEASTLMDIVSLLGQLTPEDIKTLFVKADKVEEFTFDLKSKQASILNVHTTLSTQEERDNVYCLYACRLFEFNYAGFITETEKSNQIIPMTYCMVPSGSKSVTTYLIEPSRGYMMSAYANEKGSLVSDDDFSLHYIGYISCLYLMVTSLITRIALKEGGVDYFRQLAPIHQIIQFYETHKVAPTNNAVIAFDKRKTKK